MKLNRNELAALKGRFTKAAKSWKSARDRVVDAGVELKKAGVSRTAVRRLVEGVLKGGAIDQCLNLFWPVAADSPTARPKNGRKPNPKAKALLAYAVKKYGKEAEAVLLAAYRMAQKG